MAKRRRVEMKEIENERYKIVTFSKRRKGLFKKAQQLSSSTGAHVGILVFSPNGVPYIHGPFNEVADRFLSAFSGGVEMGSSSGCGSNSWSGINGLGVGESESVSDFQSGDSNNGGAHWELVEGDMVNGLGSLEDLMEVKRRLEEVKDKVEKRLQDLEDQRFVDSLFV